MSIHKHPYGAPCWFELIVGDPNVAKDFYSKFFGWSFQDTPISGGEAYTTWMLNDERLGGGYKLGPEMKAQGVPPHWGVYFAVQDADSTASKTTVLGGKVIIAPMDVMNLGRMAVCSDPTGAVFSIWQAKDHSGVTVYGEKHTVGWVELSTRNSEEATKFYQELLGWETAASSASEIPYIEFGPAGTRTGGILQMDERWGNMPPYWGIYFPVDDCDAMAAKAKELGGTVCAGPFDAGKVGRIAVLQDPQGAYFSIIKLAAH